MVGYRPDGKVDRRTVSGKTRHKVQRALAELRGRADVGLLGDAKAGRETVGAFLSVWLKAIEATMEPESLRRHRNNIEKHLAPSIGHYKLADLRPEHLVTLFATKRSEALSPRSVKYLYTTIRKALDMAVDCGAAPRNCQFVKNPGPQVATYSPTAQASLPADRGVRVALPVQCHDGVVTCQPMRAPLVLPLLCSYAPRCRSTHGGTLFHGWILLLHRVIDGGCGLTQCRAPTCQHALE